MYLAKFRAQFIREARRDAVYLLKYKRLLPFEMPFGIQDIHAVVVK